MRQCVVVFVGVCSFVTCWNILGLEKVWLNSEILVHPVCVFVALPLSHVGPATLM